MESNTSTGSTNSPQASSARGTTAKDFFLHLGSMVGLYAVAIAFLNLIFSIIDKVGGISFPVATLIIFFPLFILLSWLINKTYAADPNKKQLGIRKWLTYVTLFIAGIILAGDLVYILYMFLDGQNITTAFLLKVVTVFVVSSAVFGFYLQDIRDKVLNKKLWAIVSSIIVVASIILGFSVIGSPQTQRLLRYDDQKITDLQNIQWQIINYWQKKGSLPSVLSEVNDPISGMIVPTDPETSAPYEYNKAGGTTFELCAVFNTDSTKSNNAIAPTVYKLQGQENWTHSVGKVCFPRTIDPELYPVMKK